MQIFAPNNQYKLFKAIIYSQLFLDYSCHDDREKVEVWKRSRKEEKAADTPSMRTFNVDIEKRYTLMCVIDDREGMWSCN